MNIKETAKNLHPLERKIVPFLDKAATFKELVGKTGMKEVEVMRALQWLSNKKMLSIEEEEKDMIELGGNGKLYREKGLPERSFLNAIKNQPLALPEIINKAGLEKGEVNICIGTLKGKAAIDIRKDKDMVFSITEQGKNLLTKETLEEKFLKKDFPVYMDELEDEEKFAFANLRKRKDIVELNKEKIKNISLTELGRILIKTRISDNKIIDRLSASMLRKGNWKGKEFRSYDVSINVPRIYGGKRHFVNQAIDYIKRIWLDMGFKEMSGDLVQTSFWDLDCLFVPQDHPARQMQDTFYIKNPEKGRLPKLAAKIKKVHENGGNTGSTGWGGRWDAELAKENLLRTHTTVLSARTIAQLRKDKLPSKFFSVGKVFRNEALDWKHLFEFYQVEGIVVDTDANLKHLKGYLKEFYLKMGYTDVRMKPSHFPYTEPSMEIEVYNPVKKEWIELGGSGIFRPEVTKPLLGFECPILAWGQGMGRIIMDYWKLKDLRDLYRNDLKQIRRMNFWMG
ncbi:phenylalanine--tRNA ligase subunit alpha [Candidatus Woesearchaeota archaeon]|nr:phenylalanine--tRNA ligase subunit alpha [Candidatus Woesearchaeota archaeon]